MESISPLAVTGTVSFHADGSFTSSANISFVETLQLPTSCYTEAQCTAFPANLSSSTPTGITSAQCSYDASTGCSCSINYDQGNSMGSGTYAVQGTNVTITNTDPTNGTNTPEVDSFCVSGNTATIFSVNASGSTATVVLTR